MNYKKYKLTAFALAVVSMVACSDHRGPDTDQLESTAGGVGAQGDPRVERPVDIRTAQTPANADATFKTISFTGASSTLSPEAQANLDDVVGEFADSEPVLLTLRMKDGDTIDASQPREQFKVLTPERVTAVKNYLQQAGVAIEEVAVDQAGKVADVGEDNPMARSASAESDSARHLVITIDADG